MAGINPDRLYQESEVILTLNLTYDQLRRARNKGELRYKEVGRGQRLYLGRWLLEWITGEDATAHLGKFPS